MESLTDAGLTVTYDEEAGVITFDWNPETHPQYNYLEELTSEKFSEMMQNWIKTYEENNADPNFQAED